MKPICHHCGAVRCRAWYIYMPDLSWWCADCRNTDAAHLHAYPDCRTDWHDGWDYDDNHDRFLGGNRSALIGWRDQELHRRQQSSQDQEET